MSAPAITEADFQKQITDLAELYHWQYLHLRPAQTAKGWRTPVQGSLGVGWPDLILVRGDRLMAVELKAEGKSPTVEQYDVLGVLNRAGVEIHIWHPADFDEIQAELT